MNNAEDASRPVLQPGRILVGHTLDAKHVVVFVESDSTQSVLLSLDEARMMNRDLGRLIRNLSRRKERMRKEWGKCDDE